MSQHQSPGPRRLIAGLRIRRADEAALAVVAPFFPEADSAGDLAYRLWRRGLEITLAEVIGLGAPLPAGLAEEQLATLVAQRLLLCLPLLHRTGTLALLGLDAPIAPSPAESSDPRTSESEEIEVSAAAAMSSLGAENFL
ncbi:MAG: hypothetical protein HC828_03570 [Blastochloris sp.]|nr:hypothetical protein [Blastochloris sp.]